MKRTSGTSRAYHKCVIAELGSRGGGQDESPARRRVALLKIPQVRVPHQAARHVLEPLGPKDRAGGPVDERENRELVRLMVDDVAERHQPLWFRDCADIT